MRLVLAIVLAVAPILAVACGGATRSAAPGDRAAGVDATAADLRQEIFVLWRRIQVWSVLLPDPVSWRRPPGPPCEVRSRPRSGCGELCVVGRQVCADARALCRAADSLPGDLYGEEKCSAARARCRDGGHSCSACEGCQVAEPLRPITL